MGIFNYRAELNQLKEQNENFQRQIRWMDRQNKKLINEIRQ